MDGGDDSKDVSTANGPHYLTFNTSVATTTVPMENGVILSEPSSSFCARDIHLRYLNEGDVEEVKKLCMEVFPVSYPDYWYEEVTSGPHVWSMAATYHERIIGIIVADIKSLDRRNAEDRSLLPKWYPSDTPVCYMLSLGVHKAWRRRGIASVLLDQLLAYLQSGLGNNASCVRCLYLHVLVTNESAIGFYEKRRFRRHATLRRYYYFNGQAYDGYTYALYLNGGQPPVTFTDAFGVCAALVLRPCTVAWRMFRQIFQRLTFRMFLSRLYIHCFLRGGILIANWKSKPSTVGCACSEYP